MAIEPGQELLHYRLIEQIGEGGMGVVWSAVDTSLDRQAAIKFLPEGFAEDAQRLGRLEREAKLLATLQHPGIAAVYGLHEDRSIRFLAMELVDGPTLHERLRSGPLSIDDTIDIGCQIADAVAAAHQSGVLHRDLKPANVKVTPEGKVKVLDFGLAKSVESGSDSGSSLSASMSPTATSARTLEGVILGTASYMSPEQARGRAVDRRTDVWSFGCVLFELLTGKAAFGGDTISDTVAHVLRGEPDWDTLPSNCPSGLVRLLRRCLRKDASRRVHDLADARVLLEDAREEMEAGVLGIETAPAPAGAPRSRVIVWAMIALVLGGLLGAWAVGFRPSSAPEARPAHFSLLLPPEAPFIASGWAFPFRITPDGGTVVYCASPPGLPPQLAVRDLAGTDVKLLDGTADADDITLSPDGTRIAFVADGVLKHTPISGGSISTITDKAWGSGYWGRDGYIYFNPDYLGGLSRVPESGGDPEPLTRVEEGSGVFGHWHPELLPGERYLLYSRWRATQHDCSIVRHDLYTGEDELLIANGCRPRYLPSGHLLYTRGGSVMATRFDPENGVPAGQPVVVLDDAYITPQSGGLALDFAPNGTLLYLRESAAGNQSILTSVDMDGNVTPLDRKSRDYADVSVSPDGARLALTVRQGVNMDIWIFDYERGGLRRVTFDGTHQSPVWAPDGRRIAYVSYLDGPYDIYQQPLDDSEEASPLLRGPLDDQPTSWSADRGLLINRTVEAAGDDVLLNTEEGEETLVSTPSQDQWATWSPDSRWIAYQSNASGAFEVFVMAYPSGGGRWQISLEGGIQPRWAPDGRTLYYRDDDALWAVGIDTSSGFRAGRPRRLFGKEKLGGTVQSYDVHPDGNQFIVLRSRRDSSTPMEVVVNWFEELERLVP
jgi:Tol biopolymer transport system component/tRNA A-37 threonylcarbamoyl transferase component Bud32